jgi:hypothetical protein
MFMFLRRRGFFFYQLIYFLIKAVHYVDSYQVIMNVKVRKKFVLGSLMTFFLSVCLGRAGSRV